MAELKRIKIEKVPATASADKPLPPSTLYEDGGPLLLIPDFAQQVFGKSDKATIKRVRRFVALGVLPSVKIGRAPKPGAKRDIRRVHIPLAAGKAAIMAAGGTS